METPLQLAVGETIDELRAAEVGLAAPIADLAERPLHVLERGVGGGEEIDGVLEGHGADALEPAGDLHPEVVRLGRKLMDEQEPIHITTVS